MDDTAHCACPVNLMTSGRLVLSDSGGLPGAVSGVLRAVSGVLGKWTECVSPFISNKAVSGSVVLYGFMVLSCVY